MTTVPHIIAVEVTSFEPTAFSYDILRKLEGVGVREPCLIGGALRDAALGIPNQISDYDIRAKFLEMENLRATIRDHWKDYVEEFKQLLPEAEQITCLGPDISQETDFVGLGITFSYRGQEVEFYVSNLPGDLGARATNCDSPINGIAMDASGKIFGHPQFEDHLRRKIYNPDLSLFPSREDAVWRFNKLRQKIPELTWSGKCSSSYSAPLSPHF